MPDASVICDEKFRYFLLYHIIGITIGTCFWVCIHFKYAFGYTGFIIYPIVLIVLGVIYFNKIHHVDTVDTLFNLFLFIVLSAKRVSLARRHNHDRIL